MKFRKNIHCKAGLKSLKLFICTSRAEKIIRGLYFNFAFLIASFLFIFLCYYISYLYNKNNIYLYPTVGNVNKNTVKYIQYKHIYYMIIVLKLQISLNNQGLKNISWYTIFNINLYIFISIIYVLLYPFILIFLLHQP
ncbi:hypothetical protein CVS40_0105 [Lucilia cuprina]|nr:hypothetical protein CVS40_0105 [Lucilia cuprina]